MKKTTVLAIFLLILSAVVFALGPSSSPKVSATVQPVANAAPGSKLTFLELGSVGCKPCEAMVPVLDAVRQQYGGQVDVIFHDVRKNPAIAKQWRVVLIPTQVFLDAAGKEYFRHEGFYPLDEVVAVLKQGGMR